MFSIKPEFSVNPVSKISTFEVFTFGRRRAMTYNPTIGEFETENYLVGNCRY